MFAGIVEAQSRVLDFTAADQQNSLAALIIEKPTHFNDIRPGDSVAVNGVCLTAEEYLESDKLKFSLGRETLIVTGWSKANFFGSTVNLERSLRFGDRVHGHLVSGHVDALGKIIRREGQGSVNLQIQIPSSLRPYVFKKGSIAINGVSLTVNQISDTGVLDVCLIPETLQRTNLGTIAVGDNVNIEVDQMARAFREAQI